MHKITFMPHVFSDKIVVTRKKHRCDACGRVFDKGTKMYTQTIADECTIYHWRECPTCQILLGKYRDNFDDGYGVCDQNCVAYSLNCDQTPEELLKELTKNALGGIVKPNKY